MPLRMFSVEGVMGLRSWRYEDGRAILRAVVAANSSIADGVASALKPRRTRVSAYPTTATARANRISETTFQGFMTRLLSSCQKPQRSDLPLLDLWSVMREYQITLAGLLVAGETAFHERRVCRFAVLEVTKSPATGCGVLGRVLDHKLNVGR